MHDTDQSSPVTTIQLGPHARVIVLRGRIRGRAESELRDQLLAAIAGEVHGLLIDLSEADSISASAHEIVKAASLTLDDRGGVLLAWRWNGSVEEPTYVLAELRDHGMAGLVSVESGPGEHGGRP
jgi:anti-anti-sigma regulatory factor